VSLSSLPLRESVNWTFSDRPSSPAAGDDRSGQPPARAADATGPSPAKTPRRFGPAETIRRSAAKDAPAALRAAGLAGGVDGGRRPRSPTDKPANDGEQRERFYDLSSRVVTAMPDVAGIARDLAAKRLQQRTGERLDPDATWLHHFDSAVSSSTSFNGWEHSGRPRHSETLTAAWMNNFGASWQDQTANDVNQQAGVYKAGPEAGRYGAENEVRYLASDLRNDIWKDDLQSRISEAQARFWSAHEQDWRAMAKGEFVGQARKAYQAGTLSADGYELAMKGGAPDVGLHAPVTVDQLRNKAAPDASVQAYRFDVNGYASSDIVRFVGKDGRQVMYLPGERQPFHEFRDEAELKNWVIEQARHPDARKALERHFSLYDRQDGIFYTGVDNGLGKLASGKWDGGSVDLYSKSEHIAGDVFDDMARRTRERDASDADTLIKSNAEVRADMWTHYLQAANSTVGMIAGTIGGPIGGLLAAGAFGAQLAVQGYASSQGDTNQQRQAALAALGADVATALLFGGLTGAAAGHPEKSPGAAAEPWFREPQRLDDGRTGYPLGPTRPPKLPRTEPAQPGPSGTQAAPQPSHTDEPASSSDDSISFRYSTPSSAPGSPIELPPLQSLRPMKERRLVSQETADRYQQETMEVLAGKNNVRRYRGINALTVDAQMRNGGIERIRNSFEEAAVDMENVIRRFDDPQERGAVDEYIRNALQIKRQDVVEAVRERLYESAQRMHAIIADHLRNGLSQIEFFERIDRQRGHANRLVGDFATLGFCSVADPRNRITLNLEKLRENFQAVPAEMMTTSSDRSLTETIEHEVSHLAVDSRDYGYIGSTMHLDQLVSAKHALVEFQLELAGWENNNPDVTLARPELLTQRVLGRPGGVSNAEKRAVAEKFRRDEMERADILVSNADFLTLMLRDLCRNRPYDAYTS